MVLQDDLSGIVQGGTHRRQLHQHLRAVVALLHHPFHLFQVSDGPGQAVDNGLLILMHMAVGVGDAVGMEIGVIVFVIMIVVMRVVVLMGV